MQSSSKRGGLRTSIEARLTRPEKAADGRGSDTRLTVLLTGVSKSALEEAAGRETHDLS